MLLYAAPLSQIAFGTPNLFEVYTKKFVMLTVLVFVQIFARGHLLKQWTAKKIVCYPTLSLQFCFQGT